EFSGTFPEMEVCRMPRPRSSTPTYRRHSSGQARVTLVDVVTGRQKDVLLGEFDSKASKVEYARVLQRWEASGRRLLDEPASDVSINELILAFVEQHVIPHYRDTEGNPTSEVNEFKSSLKPLKALFGHEPATTFGPLRLKAVREKMILAGWNRRTVNQ